MNLKHLKLFLGKPDQMTDYYLIRFERDTVWFMSTNGYALCCHAYYTIQHNLTGRTFGVSKTEWGKILMFEDQITEFSCPVDTLVLHSGAIEIPVMTINPEHVPNIDEIFRLELVKCSDELEFNLKNFNLITKYCKAVGSDEFTVCVTGNKLPMIISDRNWKIYIMPLGTDA